MPPEKTNLWFDVFLPAMVEGGKPLRVRTRRSRWSGLLNFGPVGGLRRSSGRIVARMIERVRSRHRGDDEGAPAEIPVRPPV